MPDGRRAGWVALIPGRIAPTAVLLAFAVWQAGLRVGARFAMQPAGPAGV